MKTLFALLAMAAAILPARAAYLDVINPDFEWGAGTTPANWGTGGSATFTWTAGVAGVDTYHGHHALSIGNVTPGPINCRWVQLSGSYLPASPNQSFRVEAFVKATTDWDLTKDGYRFQIEFINASNAVISTWESGGSGVNLLTSTAWTNYSQTSTLAPAGTVGARLSLVFGRLTGSTSTAPVITFDNLGVYLVGSTANNAYTEPAASWGPSDHTSHQANAVALANTILTWTSGTAGAHHAYTISPGDYEFPGDATHQEFALSNLQYVDITANGVHIWYNPFAQNSSGTGFFGLHLTRCHYVTITGATIDCMVTAFAQGTNISINTTPNSPNSGAITFTPEANFSAPDLGYTLSGGTTPIIYGAKILFYDASGVLIRTLLDYPNNSVPITANGDGTYTVIPRGNLTMYGTSAVAAITAPGTRVVFAARRWKHALFSDQCTGCQFTNLTVYGSGQMGLSEQTGNAAVGAANVYTNCHVVARPNTDRMISSNADGFHSGGQQVGPTVQNCEIGNTGDDIMNIHGMISYVYAADASHNVSLLTPRTLPDSDGGTTLRFYSLPYLKPLADPAAATEDFAVVGTPTVIASTSNATLIDANNSLPGHGLSTAYSSFIQYPTAPVLQLVVDNDPSATGADVVQGDVAMKRSNIGAGALIQNNYFHDCFSRGVIMNSENGTISDNYIWNIGVCSISIAPSLLYLEGPYSRNITISNNTIIGNGGSSLTGVDPQNPMIGAITVTGDSAFGTHATPQSAEHQNIAVTGNTIINPMACGIFMSDVTTGEIGFNTVANPYFLGTIAGGPASSQGAGWKRLNFNPAPNFAIVHANSASLNIHDNSTSGTAGIPLDGQYGWSH